VQVTGGVSSTFVLYSSALSLDADQSRLTLLRVVAYDVGENLGLLPTGGCSTTGSTPVLLLLIGTSAYLLGYGTAWLVVSGVTPTLPY
jgi:hypothetical protein